MTALESQTVYETWPVENDPEQGPQSPPKKGMWTWWRTGEHPQGKWIAVEFNSSFADAYAANRKQFPIMQDQALGQGGDWGGQDCHACEFGSDGYPDPGHFTVCDGICHRKICSIHGAGGRRGAQEDLTRAVAACRRAGLTEIEISELTDSIGMKAVKGAAKLSAMIYRERIVRLEDAIDDLWGCIAPAEIAHLDPATVDVALLTHEQIWHRDR